MYCRLARRTRCVQWYKSACRCSVPAVATFSALFTTCRQAFRSRMCGHCTRRRTPVGDIRWRNGAEEMTTLDPARPLLTAERRERIGALLQQRGVVRVTELSQIFDVSEVTIRSDLDTMAGEGRLQRQRGGALALESPSLNAMFEQRAVVEFEAKRRIGRAAAGLVQPHDRIILDSGTTVMEMAKCLTDRGPLTVVTNALNVATQVGVGLDVDVVVIGGALHRGNICTFGCLLYTS